MAHVEEGDQGQPEDCVVELGLQLGRRLRALLVGRRRVGVHRVDGLQTAARTPHAVSWRAHGWRRATDGGGLARARSGTIRAINTEGLETIRALPSYLNEYLPPFVVSK